MNPIATNERIIIPLDFKNKNDAIAAVSGLKEAQVFKVGLEIFTAEGPGLFKKLKILRKKIFLDLKLHDIPNTVAGAVRSAVRHGVQMMTIHTSGGREMMTAAAKAARETSEAEGIEKTHSAWSHRPDKHEGSGPRRGRNVLRRRRAGPPSRPLSQNGRDGRDCLFAPGDRNPPQGNSERIF